MGAAQAKTDKEKSDEELSELLSSLKPHPVSEISAGRNFKYNWYIQHIVSKVEEHWRPPYDLTGHEVSVVVTFTISGDGRISPAAITTSSGIPLLDNLAMAAIASAAPFGQLPLGFSGNRLDIRYT
ncbi:MAG TPA: TonB family protein [Chitinivibrionales bacterium]|nr:TonB family protein [Chitinivibrionales bacterium]